MQASGRDVGAAPELAAGVQLGGHHLDARQPGLGLLVGGDAAAVVVHLGRAVGVQRDLDRVGRTGQRLVDAVVDDLPQAVHQAAGVGGPDVHARPLAHRLESLEDEEVGGVVGVVGDRRAPAGRRGLVVLRRPTYLRPPTPPRCHAYPGRAATRRARTPPGNAMERFDRGYRAVQTHRAIRFDKHRTTGPASINRHNVGTIGTGSTNPLRNGARRGRLVAGEHPATRGDRGNLCPSGYVEPDTK